MKTSMLEYCKLILQRVSFDRRLWRKEYRKSLKRLTVSESSQLRQWVRTYRTKNDVQPLMITTNG
ncbi:MAG: hypothetical protein MUE95_11495 [Cyclobacteriaceae bacterium]|jgi:hypothetical protein|nr:hypothetical protein [Cyclobacteriaceae bacterium]